MLGQAPTPVTHCLHEQRHIHIWDIFNRWLSRHWFDVDLTLSFSLSFFAPNSTHHVKKIGKVLNLCMTPEAAVHHCYCIFPLQFKVFFFDKHYRYMFAAHLWRAWSDIILLLYFTQRWNMTQLQPVDIGLIVLLHNTRWTSLILCSRFFKCAQLATHRDCKFCFVMIAFHYIQHKDTVYISDTICTVKLFNQLCFLNKWPLLS